MSRVPKNRIVKSFYKVLPLFLVLFMVVIEANGETNTDVAEPSGNIEKQSNSSEIVAIFICSVKPGMLQQNKEIWDYFVERINRNESGWKGNCYYNSDESIVTYIEIFENIEAFELHEEEHLKDPAARKKREATAELISAELYGLISTESSELLKQQSISKKYSGSLTF